MPLSPTRSGPLRTACAGEASPSAPCTRRRRRRRAGRFERLACGARASRLVWPLEDARRAAGRRRLAPLGPRPPWSLLAVGAGVAGLRLGRAATAPHQDAEAATAGRRRLGARRPRPKPTPEPKPAEPTLQGAAPVFTPAKERAGAAEVDPAKAIVKSRRRRRRSRRDATPPTPPRREPPPTASSDRRAATAPSRRARRPAPQAIAVAARLRRRLRPLRDRRRATPTVRKAFGATATPALAKALLQRPPRLPANVKVPKAKVVNIVAGPSHGDIYTVSVSLLRVGVTSELRLDMEKLKDDGLARHQRARLMSEARAQDPRGRRDRRRHGRARRCRSPSPAPSGAAHGATPGATLGRTGERRPPTARAGAGRAGRRRSAPPAPAAAEARPAPTAASPPAKARGEAEAEATKPKPRPKADGGARAIPGPGDRLRDPLAARLQLRRQRACRRS